MAEDLSQVYIPLRSNLAWFGRPNHREELERQIKTHIVLYDRVVFEDGCYRIIAGIDTQGMEMAFPGSKVPWNRDDTSFSPVGGEFGVDISAGPVFRSTSQFAFTVDFLPIVKYAGIQNETFVRWWQFEPHEEYAVAIRRRAMEEARSPDLQSVLPANAYLQKQILAGFYRDALVAHAKRVPFFVGEHARSVICAQQAREVSRWNPELPPAIFNYWMNLELPDFSALPWGEICELRESDAGKSFRKMIHSVAARVGAHLPDISCQADLDALIGKELNHELARELAVRVASPSSTIASVCANFVPYAFLGSIFKDFAALDRDRSSWVSLLAKKTH